MMKWMLALCLCAGMGCHVNDKAPPGASMDPLPKWEYKIFEVHTSGGVPDNLNKLAALGTKGWEVTAAYGGDQAVAHLVLKRRKQ